MPLWESIASVILSVGAIVQSSDQEKKRQIQEIKKAVSRAFHSTERYYSCRERGEPQEKGIEFDIAAQWEEAAILIEPFNGNLANRLALKSRFWREGGLWSDEQIREAGIQLARVRAEGMTLLK